MKSNIAPLNDADSQQNNENTTDNKDVEYEYGYHPNSIKALKKHQFKKGQVSNPMGRPLKYENLKKALIKLGKEETFDYSNKPLGNRRNRVLERLWYDAMRGKMTAIKLLAWVGALD